MSDKLVKNNPILAIFNQMDYNHEVEIQQEALDWIKSKNAAIYATNETKGDAVQLKDANRDDILCNIHVPDGKTVESLVQKIGDAKNKWFEIAPKARTQIMQNFACEIAKNSKLFEQLETVTRGILSKDTRNQSVHSLTDYVHFYSRFCVKLSAEKPNWKPQGIVVAVLSDKNALESFGWILGPVLASGFHLVVQTDLKLTLQTTLLIDLARKVGIPDGTINLIPGSLDTGIFFTHSKVETVVIFDDLYKEKYMIANQFDKRLLHFWADGTAMIVYDDADLDSACENAVESAWNHGGMLPWSLRIVLVQETIYEDFVRRLKCRVAQLKIGTGDSTNVDVSYLPDEKLSKTLEKARNCGIEVIQHSNDSPAILLGAQFQNNVIKPNLNTPLLNVVAFRTINESVSLANNTRHSLAVSMWSDSSSLLQETVRKLKFANIWINSYGMFSPNIAFKACKSTANCYFGGEAGFNEHLIPKTSSEYYSGSKNATIENVINESKKAQENWAKLTDAERVKYFEKNHDDLLTTIYCKFTNSGNQIRVEKNYTVTTYKEPLGIIAVQDCFETNDRDILLLAAILHGNSVVILQENSDSSGFYKNLSATLPKGLVTTVNFTPDAVKTVALHKEVALFLGRKGGAFQTLPLNISRKFRALDKVESFEEARDIVTWNKNTWFNIGQSFI